MSFHTYKKVSAKSVMEIVQSARTAFESGQTLPVEHREKQLQNLLRMYTENETAIVEALAADLHKSKQECVTGELGMLINETKANLNNFRKWLKPERPSKSLIAILDSVYVFKDPYGVVLIIGAWNYPFLVTLQPLAGAIAAGNSVIIKPSEIAPVSAKLIADLIPKYLDKKCYQVVLGGPEETTELLEQRFDYIFYTGSTTVGKIIHAAANKYLTPTTLELGGKSPVYLDNSADIEIATRRILWGKCLNAGQTCIAPDYLLCSKEVQEKFIKTAEKLLEEWYGKNLKKSPDYCRIINDRHYQRLTSLLKSGTVALGGGIDPKEKFIHPTILVDVKLSEPVMQEEIFGPILPIINVDTVKEAITFIKRHEKPLVVYVFSTKQHDVDLILQNTASGGISINETVLHCVMDFMPFGGVGNSGMGSYHGKYSFETFTHKRSCLYKNLGMLGEALGCVRYPPYSDAKINFMKIITYRPQMFLRSIMFYMRTVAVFVYQVLSNLYNKNNNNAY